MGRYLLTFDIPSIHRFVFGTDYAQEIRGASGLVDALNRRGIPEVFSTALKGRVQVVYAHGGNGLLVLDNASEPEVSAAVHQACAFVRGESGGGIQLQVHFEPWPEGDDFYAAYGRAVRRRAENRYAGGRTVAPLFVPHARRCSSCGFEPAEQILHRFERETMLGPACTAKQSWWQNNRRSGGTAWSKIADSLYPNHKENADDLRPEDFESLGTRSIPRSGYLAVIYGDGDRMGELVSQITDLNAYSQFAQVVDNALLAATCDAVHTIWPSGGKGTLPVDVLLLGGDDIVAVTPAHLGLPFAVQLSRRFSAHAVDGLKRKGLAGQTLFSQPLTLSTGVAFAGSSQPFRDVFDRAEELLRSAKRARQGGGEPGLDFADVSKTGLTSIEDTRGQLVGPVEGLGVASFHTRPLTMERAEILLRETESLVRTLSSSRLRSLLRAVLMGPVEGRFEVARLLGQIRTREEGQRKAILQCLDNLDCREDLGWRRKTTAGGTLWSTPFGEIDELLPFTSPGEARP